MVIMEKHQNKPLILIVDDDTFLLSASERAIKKGGYRTLVAPDGSKAIQLVRSHPQKIDQLLTDMIMPGINGIELAKTFIISYPDPKILFMSGSVEFEEIFQNYEEFQNRAQFLEKPFSVAALHNIISDMLSEK